MPVIEESEVISDKSTTVVTLPRTQDTTITSAKEATKTTLTHKTAGKEGTKEPVMA